MFAFACLLLLAAGALRAHAAFHFAAARAITESMYAEDRFAADRIAAAARRLDRARAVWPGHPQFLDYSAQLDAVRAGQAGVVGAERRALLESAARDYRRALEARPLWPYSWSGLLAAKDRLGQVDGEFVRALHRAAATGPWEPRVQLQLLRSGIRNWDRLGVREREQVRATMSDALRVQPREAFGLARFYARPDLVCGDRAGRPQIERWCREVL